MRILEIVALKNGAHRNQDGGNIVPDGWAVIPDDMAIPDTFPFVDIEVEDVVHTREEEDYVSYEDEETGETYMVPETKIVSYTIPTVKSMTPGAMPEPEPEPDPEPSEADDTAAMLVDHEYRLTLLELGITE